MRYKLKIKKLSYGFFGFPSALDVNPEFRRYELQFKGIGFKKELIKELEQLKVELEKL
jgi:hypothetical protein